MVLLHIVGLVRLLFHDNLLGFDDRLNLFRLNYYGFGNLFRFSNNLL